MFHTINLTTNIVSLISNEDWVVITHETTMCFSCYRFDIKVRQKFYNKI